jgi:AcrR family transcriptional regulator
MTTEIKTTKTTETTETTKTTESTEERILDAARKVFARKGRDGARMQEIADEAGINRALLHYYFRSKQGLFEAVFARMFEQFVRSYDTVLVPGQPFHETLRRFIHHYIDYVSEHQDMARLIVSENLRGDSMPGELMSRAASKEGSPPRRMENAIRAAIESGEIRDVDPNQTLLTVISACIHFIVMKPLVQAMNPEAQADFAAFTEARKEHITDLLLNGLRPVEEVS